MWRNFIFPVVVVVIFLSLSGVARADALLAREGVDQLLRLNFDKAESAFAKLRKKDPDYPLLGFLGASVYWVKAEAGQGGERHKAWVEAQKQLEQSVAGVSCGIQDQLAR